MRFCKMVKIPVKFLIRIRHVDTKTNDNATTMTYSYAIDLWAVGCVMGELLQGFPLLDGRDEVDQIEKMT